MNWDTLTYNGVEKAFAGTGLAPVLNVATGVYTAQDWGFAASVTGERKSMASDEFTVTIPSVLIGNEATAPTFPFEAQVVVRTNRSSGTGAPGSFSGGTIKFQGKRVGQPLKARPDGQGVTYKFEGPWYDLKNTHYQQTFVGANGVTSLCAETALNTSTAVLQGQIMISVGDQIQAIAQWLLDQYKTQNMAAPFQYAGRALNTGTNPTGGPSPFIDLNETAGVYNYSLVGSPSISASLYSIYYPSQITKPLMCADAITKMLELSPRASVWFDHTTSPPTLHVTMPGDRRSVTLPLFDLVSHMGLSITRRDDLFVRAVHLIYRISSTLNGAPQVTYVADQWGPHGSNSYYNAYNAAGGGAAGTAAANAAVAAGTADPITGLRVLNELVDLQGYTTTSTTAHLDCQPVLATVAEGGTNQSAKRTWWASKRGGETPQFEDSRARFQDKNGVLTTIPDAAIVNSATGAVLTDANLQAMGFTDAFGNLVVNRLVRGTANTWMTRADGQPVVSLKVKYFAAMTYAVYDVTSQSPAPDTDTTGLRQSMPNTTEHHVNIEITNGTTGTYTATKSSTPGEAYIVGAGGIAQYLFNHLAAYQYDGESVHVAAEFSDSTAATYVDPGCAINYSGGAAEWTGMAAQCQSIAEDYQKHTTTVKIGVAKHLSAGQLSSLLQMWRYRRPWYNPLLRSNNTLNNGGTVDQSVTGGQSNAVPGLVNNGPTTAVDYSQPPTGSTQGTVNAQIQNDPTAITAVLASGTPTPTTTPADMRTMKPREVASCGSSGNTVYITVHSTAPYTR